MKEESQRGENYTIVIGQLEKQGTGNGNGNGKRERERTTDGA